MKSILRDYDQLHQIHTTLLNGSTALTEANLLKIRGHCREIHFVRSPLLLFPKWRKEIAAVRKAGERSPRLVTNEGCGKPIAESLLAVF